MKILSILSTGVMIALAGCATVPNPVPAGTAYAGGAGYAVVQKAIQAYGHLPYCVKETTTSTTNYCQDPAIEVKLAKADGAVVTAYHALENFTRNPANYPGLTYAGLLTAFQQAETAASQIAATYGVH